MTICPELQARARGTSGSQCSCQALACRNTQGCTDRDHFLSLAAKHCLAVLLRHPKSAPYPSWPLTVPSLWGFELLMFRRWVKAAISAGHLPGLCGSKDPLESEREKEDTSSAFILQTCRVPTQGPTHGPRRALPGQKEADGLPEPSPAEPGPIPVSPATRGPHAISDAQGTRKCSLSSSSLPHRSLSPTQAFLGRARPVLQHGLDRARRATAIRPQAKPRS